MKPAPELLVTVTQTAVGTSANFAWNLCGLLTVGILYSLGFMPVMAIGFLIGFVIPSVWIVCLYKVILKHQEFIIDSNLPGWIAREPGNTISMLCDIALLAAIWAGIAANLLPYPWIHWLMALVVPAMVLVVLRILKVMADIHNIKQPPQ